MRFLKHLAAKRTASDDDELAGLDDFDFDVEEEE